MKTIIRLEFPDGNGIFWRRDESPLGLKYLKLMNLAYRHNDFRLPIEDNLHLSKDDKEWFCAYKTIDQVKLWIYTEEIQKLSKAGCKVLMLDVTEFQEGRDQVIFTKESIIQIKDVTKLFI